MLWFDNDPKTTLGQKIQNAVDYYAKKHGSKPNLCLVHPSMINEPTTIDNIVIRPYPSILPGHLWIGIEEYAPGSPLKWIMATGRFGPSEITSIQDIWENHFDKIFDWLLACDPIVTLRAMIEIMANTGYIGNDPKFRSLLENVILSEHWAKFLTDKDIEPRDRGYSVKLLAQMSYISTELVQAQALLLSKRMK